MPHEERARFQRLRNELFDGLSLVIRKGETQIADTLEDYQAFLARFGTQDDSLSDE
ncbi:MAG: hypothetical protein LBI20_01255 [Holosporales bacterium]|jgi:hypothetical protein|nr:hypothetical protein [Holosporales bacterium]